MIDLNSLLVIKSKILNKMVEITGVPTSTVLVIAKRFKNVVKWQYQKIRGLKVLYERDKMKILQKVLENPFLNAPKTAAKLLEDSGIEVDLETLIRVLWNNRREITFYFQQRKAN